MGGEFGCSCLYRVLWPLSRVSPVCPTYLCNLPALMVTTYEGYSVRIPYLQEERRKWHSDKRQKDVTSTNRPTRRLNCHNHKVLHFGASYHLSQCSKSEKKGHNMLTKTSTLSAPPTSTSTAQSHNYTSATREEQEAGHNSLA